MVGFPRRCSALQQQLTAAYHGEEAAQRAKALKAGASDRRGSIGRRTGNMFLSKVVQATSN